MPEPSNRLNRERMNEVFKVFVDPAEESRRQAQYQEILGREKQAKQERNERILNNVVKGVDIASKVAGVVMGADHIRHDLTDL